MGSAMSVMDLSDALLLCLSDEPQDADAVAAAFEARTGRSLEHALQSVSRRLGQLAMRGLAVSVKPARKGNYIPRQFAITPAGEEYADQLYAEYV